MNLSIIINYCTSDERFIRTCLNQALKVTTNIIVPISDHLFDGTPENIESINKLAQEYPQINFILFEWDNFQQPRYWHNMARIIGVNALNEDIEWVLFLDSDEIIDDKIFNNFINHSKFGDFDSYKLANYWYFREPIYQAEQLEDSAVLIKNELININPYLDIEREQMWELLNTNKKIRKLIFEKPMIHHYSWVRTKEQMLQKVKSWGHKYDKDWNSLIEEEFSRDFNGKCFVNNYDFKTVKNKFNL